MSAQVPLLAHEIPLNLTLLFFSPFVVVLTVSISVSTHRTVFLLLRESQNMILSSCAFLFLSTATVMMLCGFLFILYWFAMTKRNY